MDDNRIAVWLSPQKESRLTHKELAEYLGIQLQTLQQRLREMGPDHYLTYFPGSIPAKVRRVGNRGPAGVARSTLSKIKVERIHPNDLNLRTCVCFVTKLITRSKEDLEKWGCPTSRAFLMNENGMLAYYLELVPDVELELWLARAKKMVEEIESHRI